MWSSIITLLSILFHLHARPSFRPVPPRVTLFFPPLRNILYYNIILLYFDHKYYYMGPWYDVYMMIHNNIVAYTNFIFIFKIIIIIIICSCVSRECHKSRRRRRDKYYTGRLPGASFRIYTVVRWMRISGGSDHIHNGRGPFKDLRVMSYIIQLHTLAWNITVVLLLLL